MSGYLTPTFACRSSGPARDVITDKGISIKFNALSGGECIFMVEPKTTTLRDVQPILVKWLGVNFPKNSAVLMNADGKVFTEFIDQPFQNSDDGDTFTVTVELTTDMFFYDLARREKSKVTLDVDASNEDVDHLDMRRPIIDCFVKPSNAVDEMMEKLS